MRILVVDDEKLLVKGVKFNHNFSCHCAAESRHDLHLPLRSAEGHVLRALEWQ